MESEQLIEEVRKFPVLYDQSDSKYRNTEYKDRMWKIISDRLKVPGGPEESKKKWGSIRDQFRRTLRKRKTKSGQAAAKQHKYKYEDVLEFLLPHIVERETLSNVPSLEDSGDDTELDQRMEDTELDHETEDESQSILVSQEYLGTSSQTTQPATPVPPAESTQTTPGKKHQFTRPVNMKRKGANIEKPAHGSPSSQLMAYILAEKEDEKNKIHQHNNQIDPPQHPIDIFLAGLAPTLKSLDPLLLNQAKTAIFSIVQDFELKQITKNGNQQQIMTDPLHLDIGNPAFSIGRSSSSSSNTSRSTSINESPQYSPNMDYHMQPTNTTYYAL